MPEAICDSCWNKRKVLRSYIISDLPQEIYHEEDVYLGYFPAVILSEVCEIEEFQGLNSDGRIKRDNSGCYLDCYYPSCSEDIQSDLFEEIWKNKNTKSWKKEVWHFAGDSSWSINVYSQYYSSQNIKIARIYQEANMEVIFPESLRPFICREAIEKDMFFRD